eukprot:COSAG06_NODE_359_length_16838_cov_15.682359_12_plen_133_part_00
MIDTHGAYYILGGRFPVGMLDCQLLRRFHQLDHRRQRELANRWALPLMRNSLACCCSANATDLTDARVYACLFVAMQHRDNDPEYRGRNCGARAAYQLRVLPEGHCGLVVLLILPSQSQLDVWVLAGLLARG